MEIYTIKELNFAFPGQDKAALANINLTIEEGEFVAICGQSGCGKSTLLRQLKTILTPHGRRSGTVAYRGLPLEEADRRTQAADIGFVLQQPDNGIVTDKVWHELAFGLESLGCDQRTIRLRVAETASFFGIQNWFHKPVSELSGGQKQLLNLASVMAMQPSVLILDEPTSQLDPIAAADFLASVGKINRELGTTVILTEHRLEEALPLADRVIVLDQGTMIVNDSPREASAKLAAMQHAMIAAMPTPVQVYSAVERGGERQVPIPLTVKEGRQWLDRMKGDSVGGLMMESDERDGSVLDPYASNFATGSARRAAIWNSILNRKSDAAKADSAAVAFRDVWFKYEREGPDVIKDLSFEVKKGQFCCIVGGNGTGKSTALSLISGLLQPYRGKVTINGRNPAAARASELFTNGLGVLPQNPQSLFVKKTVGLDLREMLSDTKLTTEHKRAKLDAVIRFAELESLLGKHPYDLSGGEQQRAALAKVLLLEPRILLLDEPTKGLDGFFKAKLGRYLERLNADGVTILLVSHDIEFCARYGQIGAMFFDGAIISSDYVKPFFAGNGFYTTAANRMARHRWPNAVTAEDVIARCSSKSR
ncbi:ABC transporter ATP-binding protein [Paenibacillus sacheonensis]|uniref:ATP-binding cassette domain-containing protein n=1 Tax=Paenibacillus sacheonensis TaxID=742054 RepID=A0A7X4YMJ7_9BACL|nr:ATP-binding cassette domain-containing protein [Paenibacillus sacheonensis]MBM7563102.1 energy-coupling factor transport system ATP-binding protein [Paenibacillus sacheonensis]NBC68331.1 ATP-binding cassette domain-containing protein [Paenibacillus sacheonensis]